MPFWGIEAMCCVLNTQPVAPESFPAVSTELCKNKPRPTPSGHATVSPNALVWFKWYLTNSELCPVFQRCAVQSGLSGLFSGPTGKLALNAEDFAGWHSNLLAADWRKAPSVSSLQAVLPTCVVTEILCSPDQLTFCSKFLQGHKHNSPCAETTPIKVLC